MLKVFLTYGIWLAHIVCGFEYHSADFHQVKNIMCTACSLDNFNMMCKEASIDFYCSYPKVLNDADRDLLYFTTSDTDLNMKKVCQQNVREAFDNIEHILAYTLVDHIDKVCEDYEFTESYLLLEKSAELPVEAPLEEPPPMLEILLPPPPPVDSPTDTPDDSTYEVEEPVEAPTQDMPVIDVWIYFEASFKINALCSQLYYSDVYAIGTLSSNAIQESFEAFPIVLPSCKNSNLRMLLEDILSSDMTIAYKYGVNELDVSAVVISLQDKIYQGGAENSMKKSFMHVLPNVLPSNFSFTDVYILYDNGTMIPVFKYSPPPTYLYYPPPSIVLKTITKKSLSTVIGLSVGLGICGMLVVGLVLMLLKKRLKPSNVYKSNTVIEISN